jgi:adenylate cyclase
MEIEKKFLVKDISHLDLSNYHKIEMVQDYLYIDKLTIVRKRKCIKNNKTTYTYTIKTDKKNLSVNEIEKEITEAEYNSLPTNPSYNSLSKTRYIIPYIEDLKIELDVFHGIYDGIVFAEIEFNSEEQANSIPVPEWFDKELSHTITNSDMALRKIEIGLF